MQWLTCNHSFNLDFIAGAYRNLDLTKYNDLIIEKHLTKRL